MTKETSETLTVVFSIEEVPELLDALSARLRLDLEPANFCVTQNLCRRLMGDVKILGGKEV